MKYIILSFLVLSIGYNAMAQQGTALNPYLVKINKLVPHQFKDLKTGATLEALREPNAVKIYVLVDDIEQYDQLMIERSDEHHNFGQIKVIQVEPGKYPLNYIEVVDRYPLSSKMVNSYRLRAIDKEGVMRMYPPVNIQELGMVEVKK